VKSTSLTRRILGGAAGLAIAVTGALAVASPAQATFDHQDWHRELAYSNVDFHDTCEGTYVTITSGNVLRKYEWTISYGEEVIEVELAAGGVDAGATPIPPDAGEITVTFKNAPQGNWPKTHTWTEPEEGCEDPEPEPEPEPEELGTVSAAFDCDVFVMTITSTVDEDVDLTVVPSEGDSIDVTVPAGETVEVEVPSAEGLVVDLQQEGVSVIEEGPFEITSELWAEEGCDGEGGELPVTGLSTGLIALGAVALLAIGGGLFLVARRRRVTFTA